jgi:octopine/nopaline transport system substrate-binding protein
MSSRRLFAAGAVMAGLLLTGVPAAQSKEWSKVAIATEGDFVPYMKIAPDGTKQGFEVDLAADLCKRMQLDCTWVVEKNDDALMPELLSGKYDAVIAALPINKRDKGIVYSVPYAVVRATFMVLKSGPLADLPDTGQRVILDDDAAARSEVLKLGKYLKGKTIGVPNYPPLVDVATIYLKDVAAIRTYETRVERDAALKSGHIDAAFLHYTQGLNALAGPGGDMLKLAGPVLLNGPLGPGLGVALRESDPDLEVKFDAAIRAANADGTSKALFLKWFHTDWSPPN